MSESTPRQKNRRSKPAKKGVQGAAKADIFTAEEKQAMKDLARERQAAARGAKQDGETLVLARIAAMPEPDQGLARRLHALVRTNAPDLVPRLWYGMPAYTRNGKVVCFFQDAQKFKTRYATFSFMHEANLDEGVMWPTAFAVKDLSPIEEEKIAALVRKAVRESSSRK